MDEQIYQKIVTKKEFSQLPKEDIERVWKLFEKRQTSDEEKIKLSRDLLRKIYFAFGSLKLLNSNLIEKKSSDEILKKHISTLERFEVYSQLYPKLLQDFSGTVIDFGAGINGLSFKYLPKGINYLGVEAVGQLVQLTNAYFKKEKIKNAVTVHESLFNLDEISKLVKKTTGVKIVFLFKVVDCLEMLEKNYSKKLLLSLVPLADKVVVSFATRSLIKKTKFKVKRYWFENFLEENFEVLEDFELGTERYVVFKGKKV